MGLGTSWGKGIIQTLVCSSNIRNGLLTPDGFLTCSYISKRVGVDHGILQKRNSALRRSEVSGLQECSKTKQRGNVTA